VPMVNTNGQAHLIGSTFLSLLVAGMIVGCGGGSKTASETTRTNASTLGASQEAFVRFVQGFIGVLPMRESSIRAAVLAAKITREGNPDLRRLEQAYQQGASDAQAYRSALESLPASGSELVAIRAKFAKAAAEETQLSREYATAIRTHNKALFDRASLVRSKVQSLNNAAGSGLNRLQQRLGGEAAFRGHIDFKRLAAIGRSLKALAAE
jgi:hypothetical protein